MSLGVGDAYPVPCDDLFFAYMSMVANLKSVGISTIVAAGNNGNATGIDSPACLSNVVSVGAVDNSDVVASFSQSDPFLSLLAPGVDILSSLPGGQYGTLSGTSMATPMVSGAYAVYYSKYPTASPDTVLSDFKQFGKPVLDTRNDVTVPRIDVYATINHNATSS
jgi:subtilisin family serine protease